MPLQAVSSISLSEQVFAQLCGGILQGHYAPGDSLPAERRLAEVFDVNRHVVREALKRLEQMGMVHVAQGGATRVLDFRRQAGLDLLTLLAKHSDGSSTAGRLWLSVLEMRAAIGIDAVRLCARRATSELKAELTRLTLQMKEASSDTALFELETQFWDAVLEGSRNLPYRLAFNSMMKGVIAIGASAERWSAAECRASKFRVPIATAIERGDEVGAERNARHAMRAALESFENRRTRSEEARTRK